MFRTQLHSAWLTLNLALFIASFATLALAAIWTINDSAAQREQSAQQIQKIVVLALDLNKGNPKPLQPLLSALPGSPVFVGLEIHGKSGRLMEIRYDSQPLSSLDGLQPPAPAPMEMPLDAKGSMFVRLIPSPDFALRRILVALPSTLTITAIVFLLLNAMIWLFRKRLGSGRIELTRWHHALTSEQPQQAPPDLPVNCFEELIDSLPDAIVGCDSQGRLTYRNETARTLLKLTGETKDFSEVVDLIVPWDRIRFKELLTKTLSKGYQEHLETQVTGTIRGILPVAIYIMPSPGKADELTLVIRDASVARSEHDTLQLRNLLLESMPQGIALLSSQGNGELQYANPAFRALLNLEGSSTGDNSWLNGLCNQLPQNTANQIRSAIGQDSEASIEIPLRTADGGVRTLDLRLMPTTNQAPHLICWVRDASAEAIYRTAMEQDNSVRRKILDEMPIGLCIADDCAKLKSFNSSFAKLIAAEPQQLIGSEITTWLSETSASHEFIYQGEHVIEGLQHARFVRINTLPLATSEGRKDYVYFFEDITAFKQQAQKDSAELDRLQQTLDGIADGIITTNEDGFIQYINPYAQKLTGLAEHQYKGMPFGQVVQLIDEKKREPLVDPAIRAIRIGKTVKFRQDVLFIKENGQELAVEISATPVSDRQNTVIGAVIVMKDVAEQRSLSQQMQQRASRDPLTGLINRRELLSLLEGLQYEVEEQSRQHTLCYMDLDKFKVVNDSCGHNAGDELLRQVSHLMNECMRASDVLARVGGDEFCAVLHNTAVENGSIVAEKIREAVKRFRFAWDNKFFEIGISIGLFGLKPCMTVEEIVSAADQACYQAKERGRDCVHIATTSERGDDRIILSPWSERLADALDHDYFRLFCLDAKATQPISPPVPLYHEITLQLHEPSNPPLIASAFMPNAHRLNLTATIERWTIGKLFDLIARRGKTSIGDKSREVFAIQVSTATLADSGFLPFLSDQSRLHGVSPDHICLEIAEDDLVQNFSLAQHFMRQANNQGYVFCLSRFGSGISSFAYLRNLPLDFLKIDRSLTHQLDTDPIDSVIVRAIKSIGEHMHIRIISHHLENPDLRDMVCKLGIDYIQAPDDESVPLDPVNDR